MLWVHNYRLNRGILRQTIHFGVEHKGVGSGQPQEYKQNDVHDHGSHRKLSALRRRDD